MKSDAFNLVESVCREIAFPALRANHERNVFDDQQVISFPKRLGNPANTSALDGDELVMVKIRGDVDGMFERLREEGILVLPGIVHTDLDPEEGEPAVTVEADQG